MILLLVATAGLIVISWRGLSNAPSPAVSSIAEDFFASVVYRTGESTDHLIQSLQTRLRAVPNDWQSYSLLGVTYLQKARESGDPSYYPKAEGALQQALKLQPGDYTSVAGMGALALARHQFLSALDWGERARQINPQRTYAYGVIADAQIELGRYPEAVDTLQRMVDLRPDISSYTRISYIRELHGELDGAEKMMQAAVDSGGPTAENTAWARTQLGNLYFNQGDLAQAENEYQHTLDGLHDYVYALAGLGRVRAAQGRTDEAIALLTQASQKVPLPEFVITLGDLYQVTGQPEAAQKQYSLVQAIQKLYQANGVDLDLEIALYEADHGIDPAATVAQARQAYARRPSIYAADVLAWSLYKFGNYREAQTYSQMALHLGTKDALKFFHAGMISYQMGERDQARQYLEEAISINPYFSLLYAPEAQHTLDLLKAASPGH